MSKSIAAITLAIAKKLEDERLEAKKNEFLDIMKNDFESRLRAMSFWDATGGKSYIYPDNFFKPLKDNDVINISRELGFCIEKIKYSDKFSISVPEFVKGQRRTPAQRLVYLTNMEIKKRINAERKLAREQFLESIEKLKNGDFTSCKSSESTYQITITGRLRSSNPAFSNELSRLFEKKHFINLKIIDDNSFSLVLPINKSVQ